jgi:Holliday junction resolvase RusA-like endonuclease
VIYHFTIFGQPVPWTVWVKKGPPPLAYQEMQAWQEQIRAALRQEWGNKPLVSGAVRVDAQFYLRYPATAPKSPEAKAKWIEKHIIMKPDCSNIYKAFEDALQVILEVGDQQVIRVTMRKAFVREEKPSYESGYTKLIFEVIS